MTPRRALFLDKDGVINVDHGYVCSQDRTDFIDGIFELCRAATGYGYLNVVITNQAGIARGYYTEQAFCDYMDWVREEFKAREAQIDAVYYCPHHPVAGVGKYLCHCDCRKPKPGMILAAQRDLGLDLTRSLLIGDSASDLAAGAAAHVGTCVEVHAVPDAKHAQPTLGDAVVQCALRIMAKHNADTSAHLRPAVG